MKHTADLIRAFLKLMIRFYIDFATAIVSEIADHRRSNR